MTTEEIQKICYEKGIVFHHVDTKEKHGCFGEMYLGCFSHPPIQAVVYSSQFGNWTLAIYEDGTSDTLSEYYCKDRSKEYDFKDNNGYNYNYYSPDGYKFGDFKFKDHYFNNGIQNTDDLVEYDPPKPKRKPFKRSRWTIKILRDGKDKSDYCIMHKPDGEYKTRQEARNAKYNLVKDKSNNNSWANYSDYRDY